MGGDCLHRCGGLLPAMERAEPNTQLDGPYHAPVASAARPALFRAALRHVAHALLEGVEAKQASPQALAAAGSSAGHEGATVAPALAYLRDRVCVPRDLKLPAARQFRAHLNWAIDTLQQ